MCSLLYKGQIHPDGKEIGGKARGIDYVVKEERIKWDGRRGRIGVGRDPSCFWE